METSRIRPNKSGRPRRSTSPGSPAAPMAIPAVPRRHARPKLSLITTPSFTPNRAESAARNRSAEASGSSGNSNSRPPPSWFTLDWSIPALAITQPRLCSTMMRFGRARTTRAAWLRITSTTRGSLPTSAANASARGEAVTDAISTMRPSALLTIFCATTRTSPSSGGASAMASPRIPARSSPGANIGSPGTARRRSSRAGTAQPNFLRRRGITCSA